MRKAERSKEKGDREEEWLTKEEVKRKRVGRPNYTQR